MSAVLADPPHPAPSLVLVRPGDFDDPDSFVKARTEQWLAVMQLINPGNQVLPVLESTWITEWVGHHSKRIGDSIRATRGVSSEDMPKFIALGGLQKCVDDNREMHALLLKRVSQINALQTVLRNITLHRQRFAEQQTPDQMLDAIALRAFEALAIDGLPPEPGQSTLVLASSTEARVHVESPSVVSPIEDVEPVPPQPAQEQPLSETVTLEVETAGDKRYSVRVENPKQVFPATRFAAMAGIRNLQDSDGVAYPSDGSTYDPNTPLSPAKPLPSGLSHVFWHEYAAAG